MAQTNEPGPTPSVRSFGSAGKGRSVATAAVLDFLRVAERRADVLVAALALDDLGAMLGEEAPGDAGVAEGAEVDLKGASPFRRTARRA
jgi:hypothetical protein